MKILQVVPVFSNAFGGPVAVVRSISKQLAAKGHEVIVFTTTALDRKHDSSPREEEVDGYRVVYFPRVLRFLNYSYLLGSLNLSLRMMMAVKAKLKSFDIIHLHSFQQFPDIIVQHYAVKHDVPYVLQAHGSIPIISRKLRKLFFYLLFGHQILREASKVIALSDTEVHEYASMKVPKERIEIVPNGIDLSQFRVLPSKGAFKMRYRIEEDRKVILYLGRINEGKGIGFLVEAFAYLANCIRYERATLVIAGPDDGYLNSAKSLVRLLRITDRVIFTGLLTEREKKRALIDSDLVVYPSPVEPFGLVTLEAAALAIPVIVSNNTPMANIVKRGKFGFSAEYGDVKGLATLLRKILGDEKSGRQLGNNGRQYVFSHFSWKEIAAKLEHIYQSVVDSRSCS